MKRIYIFFISAALFVFLFSAPPAAAGDSKFIEGLKKTGGPEGAGYQAEAIEKNPGAFMAKMLGGVLAPVFTGVIAMVILSYAGYTWMMARGKEEQVEKAKAIIMNTIIALIVIYSVFVIVKLIMPLWEFVTSTTVSPPL